MKPEPIDDPIRPTRNGKSFRPEVVGSAPSTTWKYSGRKMIEAPKPKVAKKIETIDAEKVRLRNRCSGMIGCATRLSTITKITRKNAPASIQVQTFASLKAYFSAC